MAKHDWQVDLQLDGYTCLNCWETIRGNPDVISDNCTGPRPIADLATARWRKQADTGHTARSNTDFVAMLRSLIEDIEDGTLKPTHVIVITGEEHDNLMVRADVRQAGVLNFWGRMGLLDHAMETMRRADVRGIEPTS